MNDDRLIDELVLRILGWRRAPGRFLKPNREWMPRGQFVPLKKLDHAFLLLDRAAQDYSLRAVDGVFTAEVRVGDRTGKATGQPKAKTITLALASALGLETPQ